MDKDEQIKYILSKGWTVSPYAKSHYYDPLVINDEKKQGGGLNVELAYKEQIQRECLEKNGFYYIFRVLNPLGFNYGIMIKKIFKNKSNRCIRLMVDTKENRDKIREWIEKLNLGQLNEDKIIEYDEKRNPQNYCLQVENKHWTHHYFVPTYDKFLKTCTEIVKSHNEEKFYYFELEKDAKKPQLSKEEIEKLSGNLKAIALDEWKSYEYDLAGIKEGLEQKKLLEKALKGDGISAAQLLDLRKNYEYEKIECIEMQEIG